MLKKVLVVDLKKQRYEAKAQMELNKYIGGVGVGIKLYKDYIQHDPIVFSIGPLNGFFPFASKTSVVLNDDGKIEDIYLGGSLSSRMRFAGIDALVLLGKPDEPIVLDIYDEEVNFNNGNTDPDSLGLPGKKSVIKPFMDKYILDGYFEAPDKFLEEKFIQKNIRGLTLTGTKTYDLTDPERYREVYSKVLSRAGQMHVEKALNPSCVGCPMGCNKSKVGEIGGNILVHSLVGCTFAEEIFSDIGIVFSCLNVLGYHYTHEDIEELPILIKNLLDELK